MKPDVVELEAIKPASEVMRLEIVQAKVAIQTRDLLERIAIALEAKGGK